MHAKGYGNLPESLPYSDWEQELMRGFPEGSFPSRLWGPQDEGGPLWTHFSNREGYGSQVCICVRSLLFLRLNWQIHIMQGSPLLARYPHLLRPHPFPSVCSLAHVTFKIALNEHDFRQRSHHFAILPITPSLSCPDLTHSLILFTWPLLSLQTMCGIPGELTSWIRKPASYSGKRTEITFGVLSLLLTSWRPVILSASLSFHV